MHVYILEWALGLASIGIEGSHRMVLVSLSALPLLLGGSLLVVGAEKTGGAYSLLKSPYRNVKLEADVANMRVSSVFSGNCVQIC